MAEKTNLREATAELKVEGLLAEKNLEVATVNGAEVIRGDLVIKTSEDNFVTFNVYINKLKKDGGENSMFVGMQTINEEYQAIDKVGVDAATRVRVTKGQIRPNTYFDEGGEHYKVRYSSNFFNRLKESEELNPEATFDVELCISSITPEMVKGEDGDMVESGRMVVKGWMPTYSGIEPLTLIASAEDGVADAIADSFEKGQTVEFFGECVNTRTVTIEEIPVKIGKPKKKEHVFYKNELVITGASEPYEEDGAKPAYDVEAIATAVADRELVLKDKEAKAKDKKGGAKTSTASKKPAPSGRTLPSF